MYIVNRDETETEAVIESCQSYAPDVVHLKTVEQANSLEGPGAIVGCIPDLSPSSLSEFEVRKIVDVMLGKTHKGAMLEMTYHPRRWTALADLADKAGWQVILGDEAMIWQVR